MQPGGRAEVGHETTQPMRAAADPGQQLVALGDRHLVPRLAQSARGAVDHGRGSAQLVGGDGQQVGLLGDGVPALLLVLRAARSGRG